MSLISCHCSTPQYSSGDFEAPPFEIHAVHFQNKMRQTSNSVTDCIDNTALRNDDALKLAVLSGLMLVQPPSHGRIQTPRASPQRLISRITSSASSAYFRQRQAVKYHCVLIFSIGVSEIIKIKYHILFEKRYFYDILFIQ